MDLHTLVFMSNAIRPLTEIELSHLSIVSACNNHRWGITGLLIYCDGNFIEAIEGQKAAIDQTFGRIARDPRHSRLEVLLSAPIEERNFSTTSMGVLSGERLEPLDRERFRAVADRAKSDPRGAGDAAFEMLLDFYELNKGWVIGNSAA